MNPIMTTFIAPLTELQKKKTAHPQILQITQIGTARAGSLANAQRRKGKKETAQREFRRSDTLGAQ
jgi:hypothetical protein